jgi:hypothetical protein
LISRTILENEVHILIDRLQESGTAQDYYRLNHLPAEKIGGLCFLVETWLSEEGKIDVR